MDRYGWQLPTGRGSAVSRLRVAAAAAALLVAWMALVLSLAAATRSAWAAIRASGPARPEDAIGMLTGCCGLAIGLWLAIATLSTLLATLRPRGVLGALATAISRRLAPRSLRRAVTLAVGITLLGAPLSATAAPHRGAGTAGGSLAVSGIAAGPADAPAAGAAGASGAGLTGVSGAATAGGGLDPSWAAVPVPPSRSRGEPVGAVVVRRGDTLWDLAARHLGSGAGTAEIAAEWPRWYAANRSVIGPDPDQLVPGQHLRPPAREGRHDGRSAKGSGGGS